MSRSVPSVVRELDSPTLAVFAVTVVALLARLVLLGDRIAHFDEARVAYWTLNYLETGAIHYRFIIHGPLVQHVNRWVFAALGANDFTMRLFVALVGGLLPLAALLFRGRLRDGETVALAALLAVNPVLLYYSRFFRSTLLVAGFMLVALGLGLRAYDTGRPRNLYAAGLFVGLAAASKENAVVYVLCWLGAGALLLDFALMAPVESDRGSDTVRRRVARIRKALADDARRRRVGRWTGHVAGAFGVAFLVALFFYAPRAPGPGAVGLWEAVGSPTKAPALLEATWDDVRRGMQYWFGGSTEPGCGKENLIAGYVCYLERFVGTLASYGLAISVFAVVGFVADRYTTTRPRPLVMLAGYWGFVSVLGYPLGTDIYGAWITVNALVPLAIPAAVGLALVGRWGYEAFEEDDEVGTAVAALLLLLVAGQVGMAAVGGVYLHPQSPDNELVQYAQPAGDMRPVLQDLRTAAPDHEGLDVLFYGDEVAVPPSQAGGLAPACSKWVKTLPLQWYIRAFDATADCAVNQTALDRTLAETSPVVVLAHESRTAELREALGDDYVARTYKIRVTGRPIVYFVKAEYATQTNAAPKPAE